MDVSNANSRRLPERIGDFELQERIGQGGMGVVYSAVQQSLNRTVAVKVMQAFGEIEDRRLERFQVEAAAIAGLNHPNVITVHDAGIEAGFPYIAMELVDGGSLAELIDAAPLSNERAAKIVEQICGAVQHAHEHGVLHRDIKPSNILLTIEGKPVVADFGMAKLLERTSSLTASNQLLCTPSYASPEQAAARDADQRSDVYSTGAVLYACVTGRPPFSSDSATNTLRQVLDKDPVQPMQLNPGVDPDLNTIICKCLEKEPSQRYTSCQALASDLVSYLQGKPISASPPGVMRRIIKAARREPKQAFAYALGAVGSLFAVAALLFNRSSLEKSLELQTSERKRAEHILEMAQQAIGNSLGLMAEHPKLNEPGMRPLKKNVLDSVAQYLDDLANQAPDNPDLRSEAAANLTRAAAIAGTLGEFDSSLERSQQATELFKGLVQEYPNEQRYRGRLGGALITLANRELQQGRIDDAKLHLHEAKEHFGESASEANYEDFTNYCTSQLLLANLIRGDGQFEEAIKLYRDVIQLRETRGTFAQNLRGIVLAKANLGATLYDMNRKDEAIIEYELALEMLRDVMKQTPGNANAISLLAKSQVDLSGLYIDTNQFEKAKKILADATDPLMRLHKGEPQAYSHEVRLANALHRMALCMHNEGRTAETLWYIRRSVQHFDELAKSVPQDKSTQLNADEARSLFKELCVRALYCGFRW